jgi:glycosyltransferase involved in cell wall biosynthesis
MQKGLLRIAYDLAILGACALVIVLSPLRLVRRLRPTRPVRSLWAGTPIINMAINARSESLLGTHSKSLVYTTYYITNAFDYNLSRLTAIPVLGRLVPLAVFVWASLSFDRFHFYCDRGLLPSRAPFTFDFRELWVYKLLRIPVLLWTYGADIRSQQVARAMGVPNTCSDCDNPGKYCICDDARIRSNLEKLQKRSRAIFAGVGDMFGYTPGSIDDTFFWPVDLDAEDGAKYRPVYPQSSAASPLRIVHAPNHRMFKGTRHLLAAVDELRAEGTNIELVLVEKLPNQQAVEIYRSADLIFDQCIMGNYGYFALEGMALGKPVMCFIRKPAEYLLHPESCPIINTHISTLKEDLRRLNDNRGQLRDLGIRGRQYIEKYFTPAAFAQRLQGVYQHLGLAL